MRNDVTCYKASVVGNQNPHKQNYVYSINIIYCFSFNNVHMP